jgi:hypothetical protein
VSQALENEMDLREYAKQIAEEKISVQRDLENNCEKHYSLDIIAVLTCYFPNRSKPCSVVCRLAY